MSAREFVEAEGLIHLVNPTQGEFTLCGDAFDLATDVPGYGWAATKKRTVTCAGCVAIILECRGVRISKAAAQ